MVKCPCFNQGSFSVLGQSDRRLCLGRKTNHSRRHEICGHGFQTKTFLQPRICSQCRCFIWGFARQGYQCIECNLVIHKRCLDKALPVCKKAEDATLPQLTWEQLVFILNSTNLIEKDNYKMLNIRKVPATS